MKQLLKKCALLVGLYEIMQEKEAKKVKKVLDNVNKEPLRNRTFNSWDKQFLELVPVFYKYDFALEALNTYGNLCNTYFVALTLEDLQNVAFQRALCKVDLSDFNQKYYVHYRNLLHHFLKRWDFCDEVKEWIKIDETKACLVKFYNETIEICHLNRTPL